MQRGADDVLAIGAPAVPELVRELASEQLYVRYHCRLLLARLDLGGDRTAVFAALRAALAAANPLDRRSAAEALGRIGDAGAVPRMVAALRLARDLAALGSSAGVQPLLDDLEADEVLQREYAFEALFAITGRHFGYEPAVPPADRLKAWSRLQAWWTLAGGDAAVRAAPAVEPKVRAETWELVQQLGGGTDTMPGGDDAAIAQQLLAFGRSAVPALIEGLTSTHGFADKRARICELLGAGPLGHRGHGVGLACRPAHHAIGALRDRFGEDRGYDPSAAPAARAEAARSWAE